MQKTDYLGFDDIINQYPFTRGTLRRLLFDRHSNGLNKATLQAKRKLIFYRPMFESWIHSYFGSDKTTDCLDKNQSTTDQAKCAARK